MKSFIGHIGYVISIGAAVVWSQQVRAIRRTLASSVTHDSITVQLCSRVVCKV